MKKNENGVTMVALVIIIIVMIIISGVVIYEGTGAIDAAKKQSINTNLLLIQAKARTVQDKKEFGEAEYVGTLIDEETKTKLGITDEHVYMLTQDELYTMGVDVSGDNKYAVDYENDEVYYLNGVKDQNGVLKYSLTDISSMSVTRRVK